VGETSFSEKPPSDQNLEVLPNPGKEPEFGVNVTSHEFGPRLVTLIVPGIVVKVTSAARSVDEFSVSVIAMPPPNADPVSRIAAMAMAKAPKRGPRNLTISIFVFIRFKGFPSSQTVSLP
jgi:hypothetical protein